MGISEVDAGHAIPDDFNVVIEIPALSTPVKYEMDKATGTIQVDRFLFTAMHYPCNYGYIPRTLAGDGDPVDVLVMTPVPLLTGVVVRCRAVGLLQMDDQNGIDVKVLAVPIDALCGLYRKIQSPDDLPAALLDQIAHFFSHYKDLEVNKFTHVSGWADAEAARREIVASAANYQRMAPAGPLPADATR